MRMRMLARGWASIKPAAYAKSCEPSKAKPSNSTAQSGQFRDLPRDFTRGMLLVVATQWIFLKQPQWFGAWFSAIFIPGYFLRLHQYRQQNLSYFCIDFCYTVSVATLALVAAPTWQALACLVALTANGPVLASNWGWRVSLIPYKFDSMYSVVLHTFPALVSYLHRWHTHPAIYDDCSALGALGAAFLFYAVWQASYLLKTEVWDATYLKANPQVMTSLRYLARDTNNVMHRMSCNALAALGFMQPGGKFDSEKAQFKLAFVVIQVLYTLATFLPGLLCLYSHAFHGAILLLALVTVVHNGATYTKMIESRAEAFKQQTRLVHGGECH